VLIKEDSCLIEAPEDAEYEIKPISEFDPLTTKDDKKIYVPIRKFFHDDLAYDKTTEYLISRASLRDSWEHTSCIIIRDTEQYLGSLLHTKVKSMSEATHFLDTIYGVLYYAGFAICLRSTSNPPNSKALNTYEIMTTHGSMAFDRKDFWMFRYISPNTIRRLRLSQAILRSDRGTLGLLYTMLVPFHYMDGVNILKRFGLDDPKFDDKKI
jgi:hypothetical protein